MVEYARVHVVVFFFFFQAEDGIRDLYVTGVQTCALPILIAWVPVGAAAALMAWKPRLAWRWMTGLPMDGPPGRPRYRTDASWNLPATKRLHPVPVIRWHWWRRRRRAAIRGGGTLAVLTLAEGLLTVPGWTLAALAVAAIIAAWLIVPRATR